MKLLRQKTYSKPDSEKSVNLGGKRTKYSEMSEKQLKNLANYEEYKAEKKSTKEGRKDNRKRNLIGATSFAGIGAGVGFYPKYSKILKDDKVLLDNAKATEATKKVLKATGIGALSGLATWELLKIAADANHKNHARLAKEELKRRGISDWKTGKTLEERNKEVLEELEKTYSKSASSFKPKFRARFRKGDFSYTRAKNPSDEALNHQAYREVAAEDEFKNNPETYKIRQGVFSDHPVLAYGGGIAAGTLVGGKIGKAIGKSIKRRPNKDEISWLEDDYEVNKKDLEYLKSGKPIDKKFLYPEIDSKRFDADSISIISNNSAWGDLWGPDGDDEQVDYRKINNPKVRKEVIAALEKRQKEIEQELQNTDKKTKTYENTGKNIGRALGAAGGGFGIYKFRKAIKTFSNKKQLEFSAVDYTLGGGIGTLAGMYGGMIATGKKSREKKKESLEKAKEVDLLKEAKRIEKIRKTGDPKLKRPWDVYDPEELDYDIDKSREEAVDKLRSGDEEFKKKYQKKIAKALYKESNVDKDLINNVTKGAGIGAGAGLLTTAGIKLLKKRK